MNTLTEKINPFLERISSPISAAFIVSWLVVNWRIVLYFFDSDLHTSEKILVIQANSTFYSTIVVPLFWMLVYLTAMPMILFLYRYYSDYIQTINAKAESLTKRKIEAFEKFSSYRYTEIPLAMMAYMNHVEKRVNDHHVQLKKELSSGNTPEQRFVNLNNSLKVFESNYMESFKNMNVDIARLEKLVRNSVMSDAAADTAHLKKLVSRATHYCRQLVYGINHERKINKHEVLNKDNF